MDLGLNPPLDERVIEAATPPRDRRHGLAGLRAQLNDVEMISVLVTTPRGQGLEDLAERGLGQGRVVAGGERSAALEKAG